MNARLNKTPVTRHTVTSGSVKLMAYTRGNPAHTPVVLVHGYPDNHEVWNPVAERLAEKFYVVTYDVRGAGASSRPRRFMDYTLDKLSADLVAVLDELLPGRAVHLVGHDWGSIQTWESVTTAHLQYRISSYTTISGPCLDHVGFWMRERLLSTSPAQLKKALTQLASSWYIMAFQLPLFAPTVWRALGPFWPQVLKRTENIDSERSPTQTKDGIFGINLYRANFLPRLFGPRERYTGKPVQLIVPQADNYVRPQLFEDITLWAHNTWRRDVEAGHWTLLHEGDRLAGWITDFIAQVETGKKAEGLRKLA
ncbi:MAG: short chain dehydrogenase [Moraxellaceae bacterium]|jgi:pimeloyl-ACP methyl ester carboxylesterase|nr:short chain dehydrogenase [Moraxellaceae bacterium]